MKILIADDEPASALLLRRVLEETGHDVRVTPDGEAAWAALQSESSAVVISDWMMPETDGLELARRIREAELARRAEGRPARYTYVILLTALEGRQNYLHGIDAGADDFLTKPFDPALLRARLHVAERVLALSEELRRLRGLLPICSYCKRIRDDAASRSGSEPCWLPVEEYVSERSDATFSHGVCPECRTAVVTPQLEKLRRERRAKCREDQCVVEPGDSDQA